MAGAGCYEQNGRGTKQAKTVKGFGELLMGCWAGGGAPPEEEDSASPQSQANMAFPASLKRYGCCVSSVAFAATINFNVFFPQPSGPIRLCLPLYIPRQISAHGSLSAYGYTHYVAKEL
ncbi:hypothetical protein EYF80_024098 [Liparis tanakae]|uniref:Uncharacterized protein n=1 Tax=Liparis tanakae TaxID=230148 RepID=A0A4Z2HL72_9TELE|nr:hypothetical protein EYF80_024098 [Liparis tanakae]